MRNYPTSIQYFRKAERVRSDPFARAYLREANRILKEKKKALKK